MSNEQNENDALVSNTYRESAQETTPADLDAAVMRMAAAEKSSTSKQMLPMWMKPAAWAATIGLTLAIVLDVTETTDTTPLPASAPPSVSLEEAFSSDEADVVQEAEEMARMRDGREQSAELAKTRQEPASRPDQDLAEDATASRARGVVPAVSDSAVAFEMVEEKKESADDSACSETRRGQAETWYDCVLELREDGRTADADREMLQLVETFPDFQP